MIFAKDTHFYCTVFEKEKNLRITHTKSCIKKLTY